MEAGVFVSQDTLLTVSALYGCVRLIVDSIAPAPVSIVSVKAGGVREVLADDPVGWVLNYGAPVSLLPDAIPAQAVKEALFWSAMTSDGNGYAIIRWDKAGRFVALEPVESGRVTPRRAGSMGEDYYYEVTQPQGGTVRVEARDMFHLRGPSLFGWMGDGPAYRATRALGIALAAQSFSGSYFANGATPSGLLTSDKIVTADQAKRAKEQWVETNGGGPGKSHQIAVVGQGIKYQQVSSDAAGAQLIESRKFQVSEIARFFGVPTSLLAEGAWTDLGETYRGFYKSALLPWIRRFDQEATRKLFPQRQTWRQVEHDLTSLTLGSFKEQVDALDRAVNRGILTCNEARHVLGYNDVEDGDERLIPTEVKTVTQLGAERESAELKALPEIFAYHLEQGVIKKNEVRERLSLPPIPGGEEFCEPVQVKVDENQIELQEEIAEAKPANDAEEDDAEDAEEEAKPMPPKRPPADVARVAIALDRVERRLSARRKDLEKNAPDSAAKLLGEERARLTTSLVDDVGALLTGEGEAVMRVEAAINAVLAGEPAHLAAERLTR